MRTRRGLRLALLAVFVLTSCYLIWYFSFRRSTAVPQEALPGNAKAAPATAPSSSAAANLAPTNVYAHNLLLRKGPSFRVYVRWLRGQMARAHRNVNPSFDDPDSFFLDVQAGVIRANVGDLANFLNSGMVANSPLKNITLSGDGNQVKLKGTLHKIVSLPIELVGTISAAPDNRIQLHVNKLSALKVPMKAILGGLHISVSDLFHTQGIPGVQILENDIFFDTQKLLPPPHIRGHLTSVRIANPDLEETFGNAQSDVERTEAWRNFLRLRGGTIDFGKLTMHNVDIIMIDISKDPWFDIDLANYQQQLVNGYTRMTPQAGLQIFMPDLREIPQNKATQNISVEWLKNRNAPPPPEVVPKR
jgi:hypothetical protein